MCGYTSEMYTHDRMSGILYGFHVSVLTTCGPFILVKHAQGTIN